MKQIGRMNKAPGTGAFKGQGGRGLQWEVGSRGDLRNKKQQHNNTQHGQTRPGFWDFPSRGRIPGGIPDQSSHCQPPNYYKRLSSIPGVLEFYHKVSWHERGVFRTVVLTKSNRASYLSVCVVCVV